MNRTTLCATILFSSLFIFMILEPASAVIDIKKELIQGKSYIEYYEYSNNTDADAARSAQWHLVLYSERETISFASERNCSLFILNETEMLKFVAALPFVAKKTWANTTSVEMVLTYQVLTADFGVETYLYNKTGAKSARLAAMYFAVRNEVNSTNYFSLRVSYKSELVNFLNELFGIVITFTFIFFGVRLLLDARQAEKESKPSKKHMYKNYSIAYFFGGLTTLVWELYRWYQRLDPTETWIQPFKFEQMPVEQIPIFSENIFSFVTFVSLGFSIMFMSNTVERVVQNKKVPIFTYILLVAELLMVACLILPGMILFIVYPWIGAIALAAFNILATYIKVAHMTTGNLRRQAISILLCLTALYLSISLVRVLVQPELVGNALSTIFAIGLYSSIKTVREIRKREDKEPRITAQNP
jgi:hypothetical protein